jgi:hypothetical protein
MPHSSQHRFCLANDSASSRIVTTASLGPERAPDVSGSRQRPETRTFRLNYLSSVLINETVDRWDESSTATRAEGGNERDHDGWLLLAGQPRPGGHEFSSTLPRPPGPGSTLAASESCRGQAVSACVEVGFALTGVVHLNASPHPCEPSSSRCPWRRCVGPVDCGRSPRLDGGRSTRGLGARQGARARQGRRAPRSCRLATRGPNCGLSAAQARATAHVSSTPRVRPPSRPAGCRRCPPPSAAAPAASSGAVDVSHLPAEGPHQSGDETADPGCRLVQHWHGCVSPPRSVEGSAVSAAPRPIKGKVPVRAPAAGACPSATAMLARGDVALMA